MIVTIIILVSVICFLLMTIAICTLRDKTNSLEESLEELDYIASGLIHEITHMSGKLK